MIFLALKIALFFTDFRFPERSRLKAQINPNEIIP